MTNGSVDDLLRLLADAVKLLEGSGEEHWAASLRHDLDRLTRGDGYAVDHLLNGYGGMGSINDVVISPHNGHGASEDDGEVATARLRTLLSTIYDNAKDLR